MGRDPLMGRVHLLLGRLNLRFSTKIVKYGSPNCVLLYFVGRQLQTLRTPDLQYGRVEPYQIILRTRTFLTLGSFDMLKFFEFDEMFLNLFYFQMFAH